jgi:hypothetical protein
MIVDTKKMRYLIEDDQVLGQQWWSVQLVHVEGGAGWSAVGRKLTDLQMPTPHRADAMPQRQTSNYRSHCVFPDSGNTTQRPWPDVAALRIDGLWDLQAVNCSLRNFSFGLAHLAQRDAVSRRGHAALETRRHLLRGRLKDASTFLRKNVDPRCRSALSYLNQVHEQPRHLQTAGMVVSREISMNLPIRSRACRACCS